LASLLRQLIAQGLVLPDELEARYNDSLRRDEKSVKPNFETLLDYFIKYRSRFSKVFVLFDALDECASSEVGRIQAVVREFRGARVQIFVTARLHGENLQEGLRLDDDQDMVPYEIRAAESDIRRYVIYRLEKTAEQKPSGHWSHKSAKLVEDKVAGAARGM
jgi:hypothetical protein